MRHVNVDMLRGMLYHLADIAEDVYTEVMRVRGEAEKLALLEKAYEGTDNAA